MSDNTNKFAVHQLLELQQQMLMAAQQQNNAEPILGAVPMSPFPAPNFNYMALLSQMLAGTTTVAPQQIVAQQQHCQVAQLKTAHETQSKVAGQQVAEDKAQQFRHPQKVAEPPKVADLPKVVQPQHQQFQPSSSPIIWPSPVLWPPDMNNPARMLATMGSVPKCADFQTAEPTTPGGATHGWKDGGGGGGSCCANSPTPAQASTKLFAMDENNKSAFTSVQTSSLYHLELAMQQLIRLQQQQQQVQAVQMESREVQSVQQQQVAVDVRQQQFQIAQKTSEGHQKVQATVQQVSNHQVQHVQAVQRTSEDTQLTQTAPKQVQAAQKGLKAHLLQLQKSHGTEGPQREVRAAQQRQQSASPTAVTQLPQQDQRPSASSSSSPPVLLVEDADDPATEEEVEVDVYVDVVGDGAQGRSSQMRFQRKAHIEFYRKLKSFRTRGPSLECQQCGVQVTNTDSSVRSHLHAHCRTAQFVCKLCQRGFQDQHLVFEHINVDHPTRKGTQCIEDRRDMNILLQLLSDCFPRVVCKAKDTLLEHIARLLQAHDNAEPQTLQCVLCNARVEAEKSALCAHLNTHPAFRCKKCKFVSQTERAQLDHQREEHEDTTGCATPDATLASSAYCVTVAFEVQLDTLRVCFPLPEVSASTTVKAKRKNSTEEDEAEDDDTEKPAVRRKRRQTTSGRVGRKRKSVASDC